MLRSAEGEKAGGTKSFICVNCSSKAFFQPIQSLCPPSATSVASRVRWLPGPAKLVARFLHYVREQRGVMGAPDEDPEPPVGGASWEEVRLGSAEGRRGLRSARTV